METQNQTTPYLRACARLGITPRPELTDRSDKDMVSEDAYHRLTICIRAANLDVEDSGDYYEPWFKPSGSGWAYDGYGVWNADTGVGPRLRYNSYDLMRQGVEEFNEYYQDFFN